MRNLLLLSLILFAGFTASAQQWQNLFDGKTLQGWHTLPGGRWEVKDGMIVGLSEKAESRYGLLITDKIYKNFIVSVQYKANKGNSGLYFRAEEVGSWAGVSGFQAEIGSEKDAGGLYETNGRAWVVQPAPEQVKAWYKPGTWNTITVIAKGREVIVTMNGQETAHLTNDRGRTEGRIALQLHGGMDMDVRFKEIRIKEL